ncbi:MAG: hypothetical protein HY042_09075 [Spirochaetia bacterium]|nr:hypothetical protein [Spirochaetia bacterium]
MSDMKLLRFLTTGITAGVLAGAALLPAACHRAEKTSESDILKAAFSGAQTPADAKILLNKRANLDEDAAVETVAVIRYGGQERLCLLDNKAQRCDVNLEFSGANIPPHPQGEFVGDVIRRVVIRPVGEGVKMNSVLVEYMLVESGEPVSHIMVFTRMKKAYDSAVLLSNHPLVKKDKKVEYVFTDKNALVLFASHTDQVLELRSTGFELLEWKVGFPFPHFSEFQVKDAGTTKEITLTLKNVGDYSALSYISIGFPAGGKVEYDDKDGVKLYRPGTRVYNRQLKGFVAAEYPLLEVTRSNWRGFYRTTVKFKYTPPEEKAGAADGAKTPPVVLVRVAAKRGNEVENFPPDNGTAPAVKDQQGFKAYSFPLQSVVMP